ncbi:MAG TPA: SPOR domain-containing protein [Bacteroidales bacterium]
MNFRNKIFTAIVFSSILFWGMNCLQAQSKEGSLIIVQDPRIDSLVALNTAYNKANPYISGYRIQIFMASGNDALNNARTVKENFESEFEDVTAYITFREPYYRVRVGDYRSRLEANQLLKSIRKSYKDAWIIQDKISLPLLVTYQKTDNYE